MNVFKMYAKQIINFFWPHYVKKNPENSPQSHFSSKNGFDEEQYTIVYVFFGAESDFEVAFAPITYHFS